jgi:hypothetical protein
VCLAVHGCTDVDGGAVELSWKLRPTDNTSCGDDETCCEASSVGRMRLTWDVGGQIGFDSWPCEDNRAVTGFSIPAGEAILFVAPECTSGLAATEDTYESPAPLVRDVAVGDVVSLNAVVVQVQIGACELQPCICR